MNNIAIQGFVAAAVLSLSACGGGVATGGSGDTGGGKDGGKSSADAKVKDGGVKPSAEAGADAGRSMKDGSSSSGDAGRTSPEAGPDATVTDGGKSAEAAADARAGHDATVKDAPGEAPSADAHHAGTDSGPHADADHSKDGGPDAGGVVYVDAGEYHGDGSFFVDGGAYPDVGTPSDGSSHGGTDAGTDAAPGCGPLAACCNSLPTSLQALCSDIVSQGIAANCATELTQLEGAGDCMGVSVLASEIQAPPYFMASDGTLLFWTTSQSSSLVAMPVGGGPITTLVSGGAQLVAVDDVNVYVVENGELLRLPKNGAAPSFVSEAGADLKAVTTLGAAAYWMEFTGSPSTGGQPIAVKSAPLLGGPVSLVAQATVSGFAPNQPRIGVTSSTVFTFSWAGANYFPITGGPTSGVEIVAGVICFFFTSDADAVYCGDGLHVWRIESNGAATGLWTAVNTSTYDPNPYVVFDDTYVYWVDDTTVGTIMKTLKAGGGTPTVLAYDTNPMAIAVDANNVYWGDVGGYIKSAPK